MKMTRQCSAVQNILHFTCKCHINNGCVCVSNSLQYSQAGVRQSRCQIRKQHNASQTATVEKKSTRRSNTIINNAGQTIPATVNGHIFPSTAQQWLVPKRLQRNQCRPAECILWMSATRCQLSVEAQQFGQNTHVHFPPIGPVFQWQNTSHLYFACVSSSCTVCQHTKYRLTDVEWDATQLIS